MRKKTASKSTVQRQKEGGTSSKRKLQSKRENHVSTRRTAILSAALAAFSARGFAETRMDDVARRCGLAKGTLYLYFKDKNALFRALIQSAIVPTLAQFQDRLAEDLPTRQLCDAMVATLIRDVFETDRVAILRLVITEGSKFPRLADVYYREVVNLGVKTIKALLRRGIRRGEIRHKAILSHPQLVIAPLMTTLVWNGLFGRHQHVDARKMIRTQLDFIFS